MDLCLELCSLLSLPMTSQASYLELFLSFVITYDQQIILSIDMRIIWIYVVSHLCPPGRPSFVTKTAMSDISRKLFNQMFSYVPCLQVPLISTIFTDVDLVWGSQGQSKAKPVGFNFSYTFHLIRMKFDVVMKQFKLNIMILLLNKI